MKFVALMMALFGVLSLWAAFRVQFLKRLPAGLKIDHGLANANARRGAIAAYYLACGFAMFHFAFLYYRTHLHDFDYVAIPSAIAALALGRRFAFRRAKETE